MSLLKDKKFLSNGAAHLAVDLLNSQRPLLLAVLSVPLGLSNALIGLISTIYTFCGAISQPLFGLLADRIGGRLVATGGVFWIAITFGLAVLTPGYSSIIFLLLGAFGSGAFHPAGTMEATRTWEQQASGQETTAASIFFLFGQAGFSIGPAIGGPILDLWGLPGLLLLLLFVVPVGWNVRVHLRPAIPSQLEIEEDRTIQVGEEASSLRLIPFALLIAFRSWAQMNMITFLPKYFNDLGVRPGVYGPIASLFMGGSAIGGVVGGWMADRYGKMRVIFWTLLLGAIPLVLYPALGSTAWVYLLTPMAGALTGAPLSITIILAQQLMPGKKGTASGLALGFTFASGALGTLISGIHADYAGFDVLFTTSAGLSFISALLALWLSKKNKSPH